MPATNKIILGSVQFGMAYGINNREGRPATDSVNSILSSAFDNKIRTIDTAEAYGNAQEIIGDFHHSFGKRFEVITKFSSQRKDLSLNLVERVKQDLNLLHVDSLYGYMFHSFEDFLKFYPDFKKDFLVLKATGVVQRLGVSVYTNEQIEQLLNYDEIDLIQLPFNLLDNNSQRSEVIEEAKGKGIEVHTRSAFLQGLFFMDTNELSGNLAELKPQLIEIKKIAEENEIEINGLALGYVLRQKNIDAVLIGVDSVDQLIGNIKITKSIVSEKVAKRIDEININNLDLLNPSKWKL